MRHILHFEEELPIGTDYTVFLSQLLNKNCTDEKK